MYILFKGKTNIMRKSKPSQVKENGSGVDYELKYHNSYVRFWKIYPTPLFPKHLNSLNRKENSLNDNYPIIINIYIYIYEMESKSEGT